MQNLGRYLKGIHYYFYLTWSNLGVQNTSKKRSFHLVSIFRPVINLLLVFQNSLPQRYILFSLFCGIEIAYMFETSALFLTLINIIMV